MQDINAAAGHLIQEDKWVPPNAWTAWPLPANAVPRPGFMGRTDDADERFILRMQTSYEPKAELEETISATMLRLAKERFQARQETSQPIAASIETGGARSSAEEESDTGMSYKSKRARSKLKAKSSSKPRSVKYESTSEGDMMDIDDLPANKRSTSTPPETLPLKTVVATDDELSYTLLRPSAQAILAKLDATLMVLHNARESKHNCPSESDASDASSRSQSRSRSRSRGPSRTPSRPPDASRESAPSSHGPTEAQAPGSKRKKGRPKKVYPRLDDETDREYAIRIARLRKKPLPVFSEDEADTTPVPNSAAEYTDANVASKPKARRPRARSRSQRRSSEALSDVASVSGTSASSRRVPTLARVRLRDWRDILGAAALAGFPAQALDRAARRCADLFGQSFTLHTLQEGPLDQTQSNKFVRYEPGMTIPHVFEDSEDSEDERPPSLPFRTSRGLSSAPSESSARGRSRSIGPRTRSQSRSASAGRTYFCIFSNCPRSIDPFPRRPNLIRHMRLVHKYDGDELPEAVDSQDEMYGAVHVDGFLRPIKIRPGWRGEDTAKENRRPRRRQLKGGEMADTKMRNADSTTALEEKSD